MKKLLFFSLLLFFVCTVSARTEMVRLTRFEGRDITGLTVANGFDVELIVSGETSAVVELPVEYEDALIFDIDADGVVRLDLKIPASVIAERENGGYPVELKARVYLYDLHTLHSSGTSIIRAKGTFVGDHPRVKVGGSSTVSGLRLDAENHVDILLEEKGRLQCAVTSNAVQIETHNSSQGVIAANTACMQADMYGSSEIQMNGIVDNICIHAVENTGLWGGVNADEAFVEADGKARISLGDVNRFFVRKYSSFRGTVEHRGTH